MAIIHTLPDAHMPFLFMQGGQLQMLFGLNKGVITPVVDLTRFLPFKPPMLDNPLYAAARQAIAASSHASPYVLWKTQILTTLEGNPAAMSLPNSTPDTIECSPVMIDGAVQFIATLNRRTVPTNAAGEMPLPPWASSPYGWSQADGLEVWGLNGDKASGIGIGWQRSDDGPIHRLRLNGPSEKARVYRVVPVQDRPGYAMVTTLSQPDEGHTFLIGLDDVAPSMQEVLVDGKPIYKSSICGQYCAYALRRPGSVDRDVVISDTFKLITPADVTLTHTVETPLPSGLDMARNFVASVSAWTAAGFPVASKATFDARLAICKACDQWQPRARFFLGKCNKCGCTKLKQWLATERCPAGKW